MEVNVKHEEELKVNLTELKQMQQESSVKILTLEYNLYLLFLTLNLNGLFRINFYPDTILNLFYINKLKLNVLGKLLMI